VHRIDRLIRACTARPRVVLAVWIAVLAVTLANPWMELGNDSTNYLSIARSIAGAAPDGNDGVRNLGGRQLFYAPGYPALISPLFLLGDRPFALLAAVHLALAVAFLVGVWRWIRRLVPEVAPLLCGLVVGNASFLIYSHRPLSEMAFMTLLIWTGLLLQRIADEPRGGWRRAIAVVGAAALVIALSMTRQAGIFVAAGFGVTLGLQALRGSRRWLPTIVLTLAVGIPASGAIVSLMRYERSTADLDGGGTYTDYLEKGSFLERLEEGTRLRTSSLGRLTIPGLFKSYADDWLNVNTFVFIAASLIVLWGWTRIVRENRDVLAWTFPFYLALYCQWPFDAGTRFLVPFLPLIVVALWKAIETTGRARAAILVALVVLHVAFGVGYKARKLPEHRAIHAAWPVADEIVAVLQRDPGPVSWQTRKDSTRYLVQYTLDRHIVELDPRHTVRLALGANGDRELPEVVRWIVRAASQTDGEIGEPGFEVAAEIGDYRLLCRIDDARGDSD